MDIKLKITMQKTHEIKSRVSVKSKDIDKPLASLTSRVRRCGCWILERSRRGCSCGFPRSSSVFPVGQWLRDSGFAMLSFKLHVKLGKTRLPWRCLSISYHLFKCRDPHRWFLSLWQVLQAPIPVDSGIFDLSVFSSKQKDMGNYACLNSCCLFRNDEIWPKRGRQWRGCPRGCGMCPVECAQQRRTDKEASPGTLWQVGGTPCTQRDCSHLSGVCPVPSQYSCAILLG